MKTITILCLAVPLLMSGQTKPKRAEGRIVTNSPTNATATVVSSMTATAGTLNCTISLMTTSARVDCTDSGPNPASASQSTNLPINVASQGNISNGQNSIVWIFAPPTNPNAPALCPSPVPSSGNCWQVAANDKMQTGSW